MAKAIIIGSCGPQHPLFGICHSNIAAWLDAQNWRRQAVVRLRGEEWLYLWVHQAHRNAEEGEQAFYLVMVHQEAQGRSPYEREFATLEEALAYANGDDGSDLARETVPARPEQFPPETGAEVIVSSRPARK